MEKLNNKTELEHVFETTKSEVLIVIKFYADWCAQCKLISTHIKSLENEFSNVRFFEVDVDGDYAGDLVEEYGIRGIPALLFFKDGLLIDKAVGALGESALKEKIIENQNK